MTTRIKSVHCIPWCVCKPIQISKPSSTLVYFRDGRRTRMALVDAGRYAPVGMTFSIFVRYTR